MPLIDTVTSVVLAEVQRLQELAHQPNELFLSPRCMDRLKTENGMQPWDPDPDEFFGLKVKRMPEIVVTAQPYACVTYAMESNL